MITERIKQIEVDANLVALYAHNPNISRDDVDQLARVDVPELIAEVRRLREIITGQRPTPCAKCLDKVD